MTEDVRTARLAVLGAAACALRADAEGAGGLVAHAADGPLGVWADASVEVVAERIEEVSELSGRPLAMAMAMSDDDSLTALLVRAAALRCLGLDAALLDMEAIYSAPAVAVVGCAAGAVTAMLRHQSALEGIDPVELASRLCRQEASR